MSSSSSSSHCTHLLRPVDLAWIHWLHSRSVSSRPHLGTMWQVGHLDFYPDGGNEQKGCNNVVCNHFRAVYYYLHSITNENLFPSTECRIQKVGWIKKKDKCVEYNQYSRVKYNIGEGAYEQFCGHNHECSNKPRLSVADKVPYKCWSSTDYNNRWRC